MAACRADPWSGAPPLPEPVTRTEWWVLSMHGRPVGTELRAFGRGATATRRRTFRWLVDGAEVTSRTSTHVRCDEDCRWTSWAPGAVRSGTSDGRIPELWPPAASGSWPVLDPSTGEQTLAEVTVEGDTVRWTTPSGPATVWLADGRPIRARLAGFEAVRTDGPVDTDPVDVASLLALPAPPMPNARRSLVGLYTVDGVEVRIDVPTWLELPPEREALRALVLEVADRLDDGFVPGASTVAEAWDAGRGDCTEHAQALAERARSAGWEARTAAGRVYVDGADGPALVLHAWTEIKVGERWVAADAALRQFPADASHLRLGEWITDLAAADGARIELRSLR